uniref:Uncharacterized protein n=1 Tax=Peronospora matthiolae TaxID=2874970 RepID=A0AAV1UY84_9STRA
MNGTVRQSQLARLKYDSKKELDDHTMHKWRLHLTFLLSSALALLVPSLKLLHDLELQRQNVQETSV